MYGLRGCAPCVRCMGLGLTQEIKIFESMFKNKVVSHRSNVKNLSTFQHQKVKLLNCKKIFRKLLVLLRGFVYLAKKIVPNSPVCIHVVPIDFVFALA